MSASSQRLFRQIAGEYGIEDLGGREILRSGLRALDQAEAAEAHIASDGLVLVDRFGQRRSHPLLAVARDFRAQWTSALKGLNLAIGEPTPTGRPEGGR